MLYSFTSLRVPHQFDQDRLSFRTLGDDSLLIALADGAGGMSGGATAAEHVVAQSNQIAALPDCLPRLRKLDKEIFADPKSGLTTGVYCVVSDNTVFGASVGDSEVWLVNGGNIEYLTEGQSNKPLLGSGRARVFAFGPAPLSGTLLIGSDGLFKYVAREHILEACKGPTVEAVRDALDANVTHHVSDDLTIAIVR